MTRSTNTDPHYLSDCHNAPVYVSNGKEGTSCYMCSMCHMVCGFHAAQTDKVAELRNGIRSFIAENKTLLYHNETAADKIMSSFATYLEQIVAEQWPDEKRSTYTCSQPDGFNEALNQTAALLREEVRKIRNRSNE